MGCTKGRSCGGPQVVCAQAGTSGDNACHLDSSSLPFEGEFSFASWARALPRLALKSGTVFGHFLSKTLHLQRDESLPVPTALFPLPLPDALPVGRKSRQREPWQFRLHCHGLKLPSCWLPPGPR